jgi:hypothetical protein
MSLSTIATPGEWSTGPMMQCSRMSARLAGLDCATYPHVLQAHDSSDVRRLENVSVCVENRRAVLYGQAC